MIDANSIEWSSARFLTDHISPSKNTTNWKGIKGKMSTKMKWRTIYQEAMTELGLPCPIPRMEGTPLIVLVTLRFDLKSRNPEVINYEPVIKECLADALRRSEDNKAQGWIDDDKDDDIRISIHIMNERGPRGMLVELRWMEPEVVVDPDGETPFFETDLPVVELP